MAKAMLIMDMPKYCNDCNFVLDSFRYCTLEHEHIPDYDLCSSCNEKPSWCPLREVPNRVECPPMNGSNYEAGYNACIDEILGGGE